MLIPNNYFNSPKVTALYTGLLAMKFKSTTLASFHTYLENTNGCQLVKHKEGPYATTLRELCCNLSDILIVTIDSRSQRNSFLLLLLNSLAYIWGRVGALQFGMFSFSFNGHLRLGFTSWRGWWRSGWRSHFWWIHMNSICWRVIVTKGSSDWIQKLGEKK